MRLFRRNIKLTLALPHDFEVDGVIGPKTWVAIFDVIRSLVETVVKDEIGEQMPVLTYGYKGKGIYPCGESFPIDECIERQLQVSHQPQSGDRVFR